MTEVIRLKKLVKTRRTLLHRMQSALREAEEALSIAKKEAEPRLVDLPGDQRLHWLERKLSLGPISKDEHIEIAKLRNEHVRDRANKLSKEITPADTIKKLAREISKLSEEDRQRILQG